MRMNNLKWKPLMAVLLGLLMVGVTAGSAMAAPISNDNSVPITPQNFGDKDQLSIYFSKYDSYVYGGRIWLAFVWSWRGYTEAGDGTKDPIRIAIPWIIEYQDGTTEPIFKSDPWVYVKVNEFYYNPKTDIEIKPAEWQEKWVDFRFPDGHVEKVKIHYKVIRVDVDDDIGYGIVYVGVQPNDRWLGSEFNMPMFYLHTWNQWGLISLGVSIAVSVVIHTPPGIVWGVLSGTVSWGISKLFHDALESLGWGIGAWREPKYTNPLVKLSYSVYPYKHYYPPFPPCKSGVCLTLWGGDNEALRG
ncbi:hypothetical protein ADU37_CDS21050 [Thermococcus sp. 2319x1]|uniref:hypothetical protein n=1 Tax=Thermococcus sp. 2319x1 TaxID=1674923 RepID=UPI00073AB8C9|nr:hypothetical protein [Thermococcus sp. 2319x1]ALV63802.1 hypothetical protein ADU37_CDS21050 [Thermococcus sp. 2319x1]